MNPFYLGTWSLPKVPTTQGEQPHAHLTCHRFFPEFFPNNVMNFRSVLAAAIACSVFSCAPAPVLAEEAKEPFKLSDLTVGIHAYTYHFDKSQGYNNYNPGLYVEYQGWTAGAYYNSERSASAYAGYTFKAVFGSWIDVTVGAVTGYERAAVLPLVVPSIKVWDHVRFSLLLPPEKTGWGLHVSFEF